MIQVVIWALLFLSLCQSVFADSVSISAYAGDEVGYRVEECLPSPPCVDTDSCRPYAITWNAFYSGSGDHVGWTDNPTPPGPNVGRVNVKREAGFSCYIDDQPTGYTFVSEIERLFLYFDTSGLVDKNIQSVTLSYYMNQYLPFDYQYVAAQLGTQGGILSTGDYDAFTGSELGHVYSDQANGPGWATITLNNVSVINKGGVTKIVLRDYTNDYLNAEIMDGDWVQVIRLPSYGGGYGPKLDIIFDEVPLPPISLALSAGTMGLLGASSTFVVGAPLTSSAGATSVSGAGNRLLASASMQNSVGVLARTGSGNVSVVASSNLLGAGVPILSGSGSLALNSSPLTMMAGNMTASKHDSSGGSGAVSFTDIHGNAVTLTDIHGNPI